MTRRQRKALIFGLFALMIAIRGIDALLQSGARWIEVIMLAAGAFGVGAAFRAFIGEWRDRVRQKP